MDEETRALMEQGGLVAVLLVYLRSKFQAIDRALDRLERVVESRNDAKRKPKSDNDTAE